MSMCSVDTRQHMVNMMVLKMVYDTKYDIVNCFSRGSIAVACVPRFLGLFDDFDLNCGYGL